MATKPQLVKVIVNLKKSQVQRLDALAKKVSGSNRSVLIRAAVHDFLKAR